MATKIYLKPTLHTRNTAFRYADNFDRSGGLNSATTRVVAAGTKIPTTDTANGTLVKWLSAPFASAFTLSGTVTCNLWALETNNNVNAGIRVELHKWTGDSGDGTEDVTPFAAATFGAPTELTTSILAKNWTVTPTSTNFLSGDRIVVHVYVVNVGTMGGGTQNVVVNYNGANDGNNGDSFIQLTENVAFQNISQRISFDGIASFVAMTSIEADDTILFVEAENHTANTMAVVMKKVATGQEWTRTLAPGEVQAKVNLPFNLNTNLDGYTISTNWNV